MKIVIFGAGGFIGGWLCEELVGHKDIEIVPCVRHWSSAVRLARRGLDIVQIDLEKITRDLKLISDADVVVNVSMPPPGREPEIAARLYSACVDAGVRKFIQFSSTAVYGNMTGYLNEDSSPSPSNEYGRGKTAMEERLLKKSARSGPQLFILRPSIVYGPFSEVWTVHFARRIADGRWRSVGWAGSGTCNLVYGQDVAKSVISAVMSQTKTQSNVLNINGPEVITWDEYIERFGDALGIVGRQRVNPLRFSLTSTAVDGLRKTGSWVKRKGLNRPLQERAPAVFQSAKSAVGLYPTLGELHLWRQKVRYSWERAASVIGFSPSMTLDEGLRRSAEWCRTHGVVS